MILFWYMFNLTPNELRILKPLTTPQKVQDFLETIPINFEETKETCMSPRMVLKEWKAHCIEGAMLAALILRLHGHRPLLVDMTATPDDDDHVIAVFKQHGHWGAISKTNHAVLGYRDPIYRTIRELVVSYFHEYSDKKGKKTLRSYSVPINLSRFDAKGWMTAQQDVWYVADHLDTIRHFSFANKAQLVTLRNADPIELKTGKLLRWNKRP